MEISKQYIKVVFAEDIVEVRKYENENDENTWKSHAWYWFDSCCSCNGTSCKKHDK